MSLQKTCISYLSSGVCVRLARGMCTPKPDEIKPCQNSILATNLGAVVFERIPRLSAELGFSKTMSIEASWEYADSYKVLKAVRQDCICRRVVPLLHDCPELSSNQTDS